MFGLTWDKGGKDRLVATVKAASESLKLSLDAFDETFELIIEVHPEGVSQDEWEEFQTLSRRVNMLKLRVALAKDLARPGEDSIAQFEHGPPCRGVLETRKELEGEEEPVERVDFDATWMEGIPEIMEDMVIPTPRRNLDEGTNVRWLLRNLAIHNGDHPRIHEVMAVLATLEPEALVCMPDFFGCGADYIETLPELPKN